MMSNKILSSCLLLGVITVLLLVETHAQDDTQPDTTDPAWYYPELNPNGFTKAAWKIDELQYLLLQPKVGFKVAEIYFNAVDDAMVEIDQPFHATIADLVARNLAGLDTFTFALYEHFKGQALEKLMRSDDIEIKDSDYENYANTLADALSGVDTTDFDQVIRRLVQGYVNYVASLGYDVGERAYLIGSLFNEEVLKYQRLSAHFA